MDEKQFTIQLGQRIKEIRKYRKMTQGDLARAAKIAPSNVSEIEHGKVTILATTLMKITAALDVEPNEILDFYKK